MKAIVQIIRDDGTVLTEQHIFGIEAGGRRQILPPVDLVIAENGMVVKGVALLTEVKQLVGISDSDRINWLAHNLSENLQALELRWNIYQGTLRDAFDACMEADQHK